MALEASSCEAPAKDAGNGLPPPRAANAAAAAAGAAGAEAGLGKMTVDSKEAGEEATGASEACDCKASARDTGKGLPLPGAAKQ